MIYDIAIPTLEGKDSAIPAHRSRSWVVLLFLMATELRRCGLCCTKRRGTHVATGDGAVSILDGFEA